MKKKLGKILSLALPILSLFIVLLLVAQKNQLEDFKRAITVMNALDIGLAILAMFLSWVFEALSMYSISGGELSFIRTFEIVVAGLFFNAITPFSSGGQPAQLYMMKKNKISIGKGSSILARKFMVYQIVLVIYTLLVVLFQATFFIEKVPKVVFIGFVGFFVNFMVIIGILFVSFRYKRTRRFALTIVLFFRRKFKSKRFFRFRRFLTSFMRGLREFHTQMSESTTNTKWMYLIFLNFIQLTLFFAIPAIISIGLGLTNIEFIKMISAAAFVSMFSSFIPLPGAAFGAEGGFYVFFKIFYPSNLVFTALILWRLITFYLPLICGWITVLLRSIIDRYKPKQ